MDWEEGGREEEGRMGKRGRRRRNRRRGEGGVDGGEVEEGLPDLWQSIYYKCVKVLPSESVLHTS